ncbi:MAG: hypothetical protein GXO50_08685 [Chlorobi bacterium]|nr:hypothetical protein [Chlorobiota bacterium]
MSKLNDIKKENAFKIPEDYFNNFSRELETRISEEKLKKQFGNKNPFTVPENYFENFSIKITNHKTKIIQIIKPVISVAAGIIVIFALWQIIFTKINHENNIAGNITDTNKIVNKINNTNIKYSENEIDIYINELDINTIYEYTENNEQDDYEITDRNDETVYQYFVDYADDNDYTELIAEL